MIISLPIKVQCYLLALYNLLSYLMITWSKLPKIELTVAAAISLETAGFIGNKYTHFYGFIYMIIVIFLSLFWLALMQLRTEK